MKILSTLCLGIFLSVSALAQDVHEGTVRFKKEDRNGVIGGYDAAKDQTEEALRKTIETAKLGKRRKESGFWKYEGVAWTEIAPEKMDYYFSVAREKGKSVVYMMASPGYGNFVTSAAHPQVIENMKAFLVRFNTDLTAYLQQVALANQQKQVAEANRKLEQANRETDKANRRQKKADDEKAKNQQKLDEQKKKLDELQKG